MDIVSRFSVIERVRTNGLVFRDLGPEWKCDVDVAGEAVTSSCEVLRHVDASLLGNRRFILEVVQRNWKALEFAPEFQSDPGIVLAAARANRGALAFASEALRTCTALKAELDASGAQCGIAYEGEDLRLLGDFNDWCTTDAGCRFKRLLRSANPELNVRPLRGAPSVTARAARGAVRHKSSVRLEHGCLSFQIGSCVRPFGFRIFPEPRGWEVTPQSLLVRGNPFEVRAAVGGLEGSTRAFHIAEREGVVVNIYVELVASKLGKFGGPSLDGGVAAHQGVAVWYTVEDDESKWSGAVSLSEPPSSTTMVPGVLLAEKLRAARVQESAVQACAVKSRLRAHVAPVDDTRLSRLQQRVNGRPLLEEQLETTTNRSAVQLVVGDVAQEQQVTASALSLAQFARIAVGSWKHATGNFDIVGIDGELRWLEFHDGRALRGLLAADTDCLSSTLNNGDAVRLRLENSRLWFSRWSCSVWSVEQLAVAIHPDEVIAQKVLTQTEVARVRMAARTWDITSKTAPESIWDEVSVPNPLRQLRSCNCGPKNKRSLFLAMCLRHVEELRKCASGEPLVYVSFGSGDLWFDWWLTEALVTEGFAIKAAHFIDLLYTPDACRMAREGASPLGAMASWLGALKIPCFAHGSVDQCRRTNPCGAHVVVQCDADSTGVDVSSMLRHGGVHFWLQGEGAMHGTWQCAPEGQVCLEYIGHDRFLVGNFGANVGHKNCNGRSISTRAEGACSCPSPVSHFFCTRCLVSVVLVSCCVVSLAVCFGVLTHRVYRPRTCWRSSLLKAARNKSCVTATDLFSGVFAG